MPALKNPRHEAFAQAYVRGEHAGNATAAHRAVYGKQAANNVCASKVLAIASVSARVAELQSEIASIEAEANDDAAKKLGITKEWVLERLVENVERPGKRKYDPNIAAKCLELLGKHVGMFIASDAPNVNVNVGVQFVDHPPAETRQEWEARRRLELAPKANGHANGNGKGHS
jgi:uncharacterized small protein (DUF1192 family)